MMKVKCFFAFAVVVGMGLAAAFQAQNYEKNLPADNPAIRYPEAAVNDPVFR